MIFTPPYNTEAFLRGECFFCFFFAKKTPSFHALTKVVRQGSAL